LTVWKSGSFLINHVERLVGLGVTGQWKLKVLKAPHDSWWVFHPSQPGRFFQQPVCSRPLMFILSKVAGTEKQYFIKEPEVAVMILCTAVLPR
jgi:hypothetical protein